MNGARILVVEDHPDTRDLLSFVLESAGATVTAVEFAALAVQRLLTHPFTELLSDVGLPGEDGCTLMSRVRAMSPKGAPVLPAMALTGYAGVDDRARLLAAGSQQILTKPIDPPALVASMAALIQNCMARQ